MPGTKQKSMNSYCNHRFPRRILAVVILLSLSVSGASAQPLLPREIPTPNATNLGRYGDIPVSYYTGRADISIPLFSMNVRGLEFPIALNYDASGIQANALPGWTGVNWSLSAGGVITRSVNDYYDELTFAESPVPFSNYFTAYKRLREEQDDLQKLKLSAKKHEYDFAPDVFYFNFLGKSGSFFLGNDGEWKVRSDSNIDVVFDVKDKNNYISPFVKRYPGTSSDIPKSIKGFTLRDENGYVYEFGGNVDAIEYSVNFFSQNLAIGKMDPLMASSWYLTRIKDRYGNVLYQLEYQRGTYMAQFYHCVTSVAWENKAEGKSGLFSSLADLSPYELHWEYGSDMPYGGTLNAPVYLSGIKAMNGINVIFNRNRSSKATEELYPDLNVNSAFSSVSENTSNHPWFYFLQSSDPSVAKYQYTESPKTQSGQEAEKTKRIVNALYSTRLEMLSSIRVTHEDSPNASRKWFNLVYDYSGRIHLTKVQCYSGSNIQSVGNYVFNYKDFGKVPSDYLTRRVDHWGYVNGTAFNFNSVIPMDLQRNPSKTSLQYGLLEEVIYPTGGKSKLEFESHDFSRRLSWDRHELKDSTGIAGGVRIKKITEYSDKDESQLLRERTFTYKDPTTGKSSGELFAAPRYTWSWKAHTEDPKASVVLGKSQSTSLVPLSNSFGPHIGYSYVTVKEKNGKTTRYHYSNISSSFDERGESFYSDDPPSPYDKYTERGYKRGKLLSVEEMDGGNKLLHGCYYTYRSDDVESDYVLSANLAYHNEGNSAVFGFYVGGVYKLFYRPYDVVEEKEVSVYGSQKVTTTKTYTKKDTRLSLSRPYIHKTDVRLLTQTTEKRGSDTFKTTYTYPSMSSASGCRYLYDSQFFLQPVETQHERNGKFSGRTQTTFRQLGSGKYVEDAYISYKTSSVPDTVVRYVSYTPTCALSSYKSKDGQLVRLLWGWNDCYLLGKGVGAESSSFTFDSRQMFNQTALQNAFKAYRSSNPSVLLTSYTYNYLGDVTSITQPNGNVTYYEYKNDYKLSCIKDYSGKTVKRIEYHLAK